MKKELERYIRELMKAQKEIEGYAKRIKQDVEEIDVDGNPNCIWDCIFMIERDFDSLSRYAEHCRRIAVKMNDYVEEGE